jgi:hypothetical protein
VTKVTASHTPPHPTPWADSYEGYCDKEGQCVTVDSNDLLDELDKFLNGLSPKNAWKWVKEHWPYALAILAGIIFLTVGLVCTRQRGRAIIVDDEDADKETVPLMRRGSTASARSTRSTLSARSVDTLSRDPVAPWHHPAISERQANRLLTAASCTGWSMGEMVSECVSSREVGEWRRSIV